MAFCNGHTWEPMVWDRLGIPQVMPRCLVLWLRCQELQQVRHISGSLDPTGRIRNWKGIKYVGGGLLLTVMRIRIFVWPYPWLLVTLYSLNQPAQRALGCRTISPNILKMDYCSSPVMFFSSFHQPSYKSQCLYISKSHQYEFMPDPIHM